MSVTQEVRFHCEMGANAFQVRKIKGIERLGRPFEYSVELRRLSTAEKPQVSEMLGNGACVSLLMSDAKTRYFHGNVVSFEKGGVEGRFDIYKVELRPWMWAMKLGADCRIFQGKTAVEVIKSVLGEYDSSHLEDKLTASYRARAFCVQYRESDFDFVGRLMEDEGIFYYFKHEQDKHVMVLCDSGTALGDLPDSTLVWAEGARGETARIDTVLEWRRQRVMRSLKFAHTDYDFESPTTDLSAQSSYGADYPTPNTLEVFDYPGEYDDQAQSGQPSGKQKEGERLAGLRAHVFQSHQDLIFATSEYRGLETGRRFTLSEHDDAGEYLITELRLAAQFGGLEASDRSDNTGYLAEFTAVPADAPFLPAPQTKRPVIAGPQTAVVVGGDGDEILTDKYGRVKVKFRWDRTQAKNADSSCWIRVSHPWASKGFGHIALPRVGDEVVVEFLEGNPDRPLITGRVYNGDNMPPYPLPDRKTVSGMRTRSSTGGGEQDFNELRFDDKQGSEYVWLQAQKDFHRLVKNDARDTVDNDVWSHVGNNAYYDIVGTYSLKLGGVAKLQLGDDVHAKIAGDLNAKVGGNVSLDSTGKIDAKTDQALKAAAEGGIDLQSAAAINVGADGQISIKSASSVVIEAGMQLTLKVGGNFVVITEANVAINGTMVDINSGGSPGSAQSAAQASPTAPQEPADFKADQDPLSSSGDGAGGGGS